MNMTSAVSVAFDPLLPWTVLAVLGAVGLVLVCLLAAVLASILPGRRAANATPTEALAVD